MHRTTDFVKFRAARGVQMAPEERGKAAERAAWIVARMI